MERYECWKAMGAFCFINQMTPEMQEEEMSEEKTNRLFRQACLNDPSWAAVMHTTRVTEDEYGREHTVHDNYTEAGRTWFLQTQCNAIHENRRSLKPWITKKDLLTFYDPTKTGGQGNGYYRERIWARDRHRVACERRLTIEGIDYTLDNRGIEYPRVNLPYWDQWEEMWI